jgi:hypothetical protein
MLKKKVRHFLAGMIVSALVFQSCTTILKRKSQVIPVTSNPVGAEITVDGKEMGSTPLGLKLSKKRSHVIRVDKQGYNPLEIRINRKTSDALALSILGNAIVFGPVGVLLSASLGNHRLKNLEGEIIMGLLLGAGAGLFVDSLSGANYALTPVDLDVAMTQVEGKPQPSAVFMDSGEFQNIKWIRIHLSDSRTGK